MEPIQTQFSRILVMKSGSCSMQGQLRGRQGATRGSGGVALTHLCVNAQEPAPLVSWSRKPYCSSLSPKLSGPQTGAKKPNSNLLPLSTHI